MSDDSDSSDFQFSEDEGTAANPNHMSWQEFLIELVRARPAVYDKHHRDYKEGRGIKVNLWKDISDSMVDAGFLSLKGSATSMYIKFIIIIYNYYYVN